MAKILVVDDSESIRTQLKSLLTEKGHSVVEAADGEDGLSTLNGNKDVNLIICDVNMPKMDGITMCTKVSEDASVNSIPIFMLTTESNADLKEKGKKAGVRAWITKPYSDDKLLSAIQKVCG
ncbi:MAG: response regulator [Halobacteriovoraceae bacterium]|nr:response regulator [Halobacteriovoraceae bacterium]